MKKLLFLSILLLGSASIFGAAEGKQSSPQNNSKDNLRKPLPLYETFDNDGVNLGVRGDILYMVYNTPVLTYASEQTTTSNVLNSKILNVPGKLSLGCNLALMYTMHNQPGYSLEAEWYHIVAKFSRNDVANNILPAHVVALTIATPAKTSIYNQLAINFFDLLIKKQFSFGDWVSVTPAVGLIGGYMNGKSNANFAATSGSFSAVGNPPGTMTPTTIASLSYTNKFAGIGTKFGGCASFKIWQGFKLRAELFYSVLYGLSKATLNYSHNGLFAGLKGSDARCNQHHGNAFFDSLLGLAWEGHFCKDAFFLDLHAGWKFQTFSDGWKAFEAQFNDSLQDLSIQGQGLQAGVTFRF